MRHGLGGRTRQVCREKELLTSDIFICQKCGSCFFLRRVFFCRLKLQRKRERVGENNAWKGRIAIKMSWFGTGTPILPHLPQWMDFFIHEGFLLAVSLLK